MRRPLAEINQWWIEGADVLYRVLVRLRDMQEQGILEQEIFTRAYQCVSQLRDEAQRDNNANAIH